MARCIQEFPALSLRAGSSFTLPLPRVSTFLSCQVRAGKLLLWFEVDPSCVVVGEEFSIIPTNAFVPFEHLRYITTFHIDDESFHLYRGALRPGG